MSVQGGDKAVILVINRDQLMAGFWEQKFQQAGYAVRWARSVGQALGQLETESFDLAIFLFDAPRLEELIVLRKLKETQPSLKLITCGPVENSQVNDYLTKAKPDVITEQPCTAQELIELVQNQLDPGLPRMKP